MIFLCVYTLVWNPASSAVRERHKIHHWQKNLEFLSCHPSDSTRFFVASLLSNGTSNRRDIHTEVVSSDIYWAPSSRINAKSVTSVEQTCSKSTWISQHVHLNHQHCSLCVMFPSHSISRSNAGLTVTQAFFWHPKDLLWLFLSLRFSNLLSLDKKCANCMHRVLFYAHQGTPKGSFCAHRK